MADVHIFAWFRSFAWLNNLFRRRIDSWLGRLRFGGWTGGLVLCLRGFLGSGLGRIWTLGMDVVGSFAISFGTIIRFLWTLAGRVALGTARSLSWTFISVSLDITRVILTFITLQPVKFAWFFHPMFWTLIF